MNIIMVGCGKIGQSLAKQLSEDHNDITVVDTSPDKVKEVSTSLDVLGVVGNGATLAVQEEAGIAKADLLIAVTGSDELNLLCCLIAKKARDCRTIARVRRPEYSADVDFLQNELGLAMVINPQQATAEEIARVLRFPSAIKIDTFGGGLVELLKFRIPEKSALIGLSVREVVSKLRCNVLICTVERGEEAYIANAGLTFAARDVISIVASPKSAADFFKKIGYRAHAVGSVMIAGGGETAHYLCESLSHSGIAIKIIEKNPATCEDLCARFPDIPIICGNAGDEQTLMEEGLGGTDAFVALTNLDEENILLSLFAKGKGVSKIVAKIKRLDFDGVIRHLDLDTVVYPKNVAADLIVRYVRAMKNSIGSNVETLYNVIQDKVEASEFIIRKNSPIVGVPLSELTFKEHMLIAAIVRDKHVIIPHGQDRIQPDDRVVVVSGITALHDITDILK